MMDPSPPRTRGLVVTAAIGVVVALAGAAIGLSQTPHQAPMHGGGMSAGSAQMAAGVKTVSLPLTRTGEHVLVPVSINGSAPILLVFDTGMPSPGVLLYDSERVRALGLEFGPEQVQVGGAGGQGQAIQARMARNVTLEVGGAKVSGTVALVLPPPPHLSNLHAGVIGAALFRNFVVTLDHDRGVVELTRPINFTAPKDAGEVALEMNGNTAYVKVGLVGRGGAITPLRLILDCGATHAVSLNATSHDSIRVPAGAIASRIGRGMSGSVTGHVGRIPGLVLGGHRLERVIATFPDSVHENPRGLDSRNGNLGAGVLGRFNVTFDYAGKKMYLVPNRRFAEPFEWDMSGLVLDPGAHGALVVAEVVPGSPAAIAGVEAGDVLLAIDGEPVTNAEYFATRERLRHDGAELELRMRHGAEERAVRFRLERRL